MIYDVLFMTFVFWRPLSGLDIIRKRKRLDSFWIVREGYYRIDFDSTVLLW